MGELGLTPLARTRLAIDVPTGPKPWEYDPAERFFGDDLLAKPIAVSAMGRPAASPEPSQRRQIEAMVGYGIPEADVARVLGIDPKTLRQHYEKVAESLFRKATGEGRQSVTAAIFWLKTRARWKEISVHEMAERNEPVKIEFVGECVAPDHEAAERKAIRGFVTLWGLGRTRRCQRTTTSSPAGQCVDLRSVDRKAMRRGEYGASVADPCSPDGGRTEP